MYLLSGSESNEKLKKSNGKGFLLHGLSLRPACGSGFNVCKYKGACEKTCVLEFAGRGNMPNVRTARDRKTRLFFENKQLFLNQLKGDIALSEKQASKKGLNNAIRLNVASDLPFERIDKGIFDCNSIFYDYTKYPDRFDNLPDNYHLTYSYNETTSDDIALRYLHNGINVAIVFNSLYNPSQGKIDPLPIKWKIGNDWFDVVNGDLHDIRIPDFDGIGKIIGLHGKGGKAIVKQGVESGFIQNVY